MLQLHPEAPVLLYQYNTNISLYLHQLSHCTEKQVQNDKENKIKQEMNDFSHPHSKYTSQHHWAFSAPIVKCVWTTALKKAGHAASRKQ